LLIKEFLVRFREIAIFRNTTRNDSRLLRVQAKKMAIKNADAFLPKEPNANAQNPSTSKQIPIESEVAMYGSHLRSLRRTGAPKKGSQVSLSRISAPRQRSIKRCRTL
jgi:hypothetical protein